MVVWFHFLLKAKTPAVIVSLHICPSKPSFDHSFPFIVHFRCTSVSRIHPSLSSTTYLSTNLVTFFLCLSSLLSFASMIFVSFFTTTFLTHLFLKPNLLSLGFCVFFLLCFGCFSVFTIFLFLPCFAFRRFVVVCRVPSREHSFFCFAVASSLFFGAVCYWSFVVILHYHFSPTLPLSFVCQFMFHAFPFFYSSTLRCFLFGLWLKLNNASCQGKISLSAVWRGAFWQISLFLRCRSHFKGFQNFATFSFVFGFSLRCGWQSWHEIRPFCRHSALPNQSSHGTQESVSASSWLPLKLQNEITSHRLGSRALPWCYLDSKWLWASCHDVSESQLPPFAGTMAIIFLWGSWVGNRGRAFHGGVQGGWLPEGCIHQSVCNLIWPRSSMLSLLLSSCACQSEQELDTLPPSSLAVHLRAAACNKLLLAQA